MYAKTITGALGNDYRNSSLSAVINAGASKNDAPGFDISDFSGLTPTNSKIIASIRLARINSGAAMSVNLPVFGTHAAENSYILGGDTTFSIEEDGTVCFMGERTEFKITNGRWQDFVIAIDTGARTASLYCNKVLAAEKSIGKVTGIDSASFSFFGENEGEWYIDSLDVKTADEMPAFEADGYTVPLHLTFDGLETNKVYGVGDLNYVNFGDNTKEVYKFESVSGVYGKNTDDTALKISNTSESVNLSGYSSGSDDERYHGISAELDNPMLGTGGCVVFETDFAADSLKNTKTIKAVGYNSKNVDVSMPNLLQITQSGVVSVLGKNLQEDGSNITLIPEKWYNLRVVIYPGDGKNGVPADIYWDGKLLYEKEEFSIGGSWSNKFGGLKSIEAGYKAYVAKQNSPVLSDGNPAAYETDGFLLDNTVYRVYQNTVPELKAATVTSYNPYYFHTMDSKKGIVYTYGQDISRFLDKLNTDGINYAEFVGADGNGITSGKADNAAYMRALTADGRYIYYKTEKGTDEYLLSLGESINTDNKWNRDLSGFYEYEQPDVQKLKGSALDASSVLDGPAGKYGFVQSKGDGFVCVDSDGNETPIQFWGTNVTVFPDSHEEADMLADSIAAAGFNIVRMHKMDGGANRGYTVFGQYPTSGKKLSDVQMEKVCYFLNALKQRGIYYYIDITCGRKMFDDDNIKDKEHYNKVSCYWDSDVMGILEEFTEMYLSYVNPYTGLALKDDPAMALIDLNNENAFFSFDFNTQVTLNDGSKDSFRNGYYYKELKQMYNEWLVKKYGSIEKLKEAWAYKPSRDYGYQNTVLMSDEDPTLGTVEISDQCQLFYRVSDNGEKTVVSDKDDWTEYYHFTNARIIDENRFKASLKEKYYARRISHMRNIGVRCAVTGDTCWGDIRPEKWYSSSKTDFVDTHLYWSHLADGQGLTDPGTRFNTNTYFKDAQTGETITGVTSNLTADGLGLVGQALSARVYSKPYTISEWKVCPANPYIAEGPLIFAAYGRLQGWNPLEFIFQDSNNLQTRLKNDEKYYLNGVFLSADNPILRAMFPSSAYMFLRKDVSEAASGYYSNYTDNAEDSNDIYYAGKNSDGTTTWSIRRLFPELGNYGLVGKTGVAFLNSDIDVVNDNSIKEQVDNATKGDKVYKSQTGELETNLKSGIFKMNTKNSQAICGFIGGKNISSGNLSVKLDNDYSAVTLTSLDNKPIESGERLLLTMAGNALNYGQLMSEDGTTLKKTGQSPIMVEQITGEVKINISGDFDVYPLTSSGERKTPLKVTKSGGGIKFNVLPSVEAMHFEIVKKQG